MSAPAAVERMPMTNGTRSDETKTFRGRTLEEVLPQIKADLGPDAEIVRQREGLMGGVGGFFQRPCIEVDARAAESPAPARPARRFDAYDDEPALPEPLPDQPGEEPLAFEPDPLLGNDAPTAEGLSAPGIQEILRQAAPFAEHLSASLRQPAPEPAPEPQPEQEPQPEPEPQPAPLQQPLRAPVAGARPQIAGAIEEALVAAGIASERASEMVAETVSHLLPFGSPRRLRKLVRQALAHRIPVAPSPAAGGRSLAFAGPGGSGKTLCTARIAAAYAAGSDLPVVCIALRPPDGGAELRGLLEPLGVGVTAVESAEQARAHVAGALSHALVVVDTPAVSPGAPADVGRLGAELETLALDEVHLALPATYSGAAAAELADRLAPLGPTHVALTHLDETTRVGGLVDFVIDAGRPLSYVSQGTGVPGRMEPADPLDIASLVLP
jgi:flagellar biosynthesis GTPase FlhF